MIARLGSIAQRRRLLVVRSEAQREALAEAARPLRRRLAMVDRVVGTVRAYPVLAGVATGAAAAFGPGRLIGWLARAAAAYSLLRRI